MDGWNTSFILGWPIFRCYVSFREGKTFSVKVLFSETNWESSYEAHDPLYLWIFNDIYVFFFMISLTKKESPIICYLCCFFHFEVLSACSKGFQWKSALELLDCMAASGLSNDA